MTIYFKRQKLMLHNNLEFEGIIQHNIIIEKNISEWKNIKTKIINNFKDIDFSYYNLTDIKISKARIKTIIKSCLMRIYEHLYTINEYELSTFIDECLLIIINKIQTN